MAVKRSFSSAIVYSRRLPKGKVDLMILFLMDNHCDLFKVSQSLNFPLSQSVQSASGVVGGMKQSASLQESSGTG